MEHPYFRQYHDPNDEPVSEAIDVDNEVELNIDQWRQLIWNEIIDFEEEKIRRANAASWWSS